jgi:hypothetical protein
VFVPAFLIGGALGGRLLQSNSALFYRASVTTVW